MPMISANSQSSVSRDFNLIHTLKKKCSACTFLQGKAMERIFIYSLVSRYQTLKGPATIAAAIFDNGKTVAIYTPKYLSENQLVVLDFMLRDCHIDDNIVVFRQRDFDFIKNNTSYKGTNVTLSK